VEQPGEQKKLPAITVNSGELFVAGSSYLDIGFVNSLRDMAAHHFQINGWQASFDVAQAARKSDLRSS
jgi:hypothetical protein